jgi:hypothetical protein
VQLIESIAAFNTPRKGGFLDAITPAKEVIFGSNADGLRLILSQNHSLASPIAETWIDRCRHSKPKVDHEGNKKCRTTLLPLDNNNDALNINRNVILPLNSLISFLQANFSCKKCCRTINKNNTVKAKHKWKSLALQQDCTSSVVAVPWVAYAQMLYQMLRKNVLKISNREPYTNGVNAGNIQLNRQLVMGLQHL